LLIHPFHPSSFVRFCLVKTMLLTIPSTSSSYSSSSNTSSIIFMILKSSILIPRLLSNVFVVFTIHKLLNLVRGNPHCTFYTIFKLCQELVFYNDVVIPHKSSTI